MLRLAMPVSSVWLMPMSLNDEYAFYRLMNSLGTGRSAIV